MTLPTLITISLSHYCEKARWALERIGIPFREERHAPVFHMLPSLRAGGRRTTPVLVASDGVHKDSTDILRWANERARPGRELYPTDRAARAEVEALCARIDDELGPHIRRAIYHEILPHPRVTLPMMTHEVPRHERVLMPFCYPVVRTVIKKALRVDAAGAARSREKTSRVFEEIGKRLGDGRQFLMGDKFGAADITFASLAAVAVAAQGYGVPLPALEELSAAAASFIRSLRDTPAGAFCLRMYRDERR